MQTSKIHFLFICFLSFLVASCGFHLRGDYKLPAALKTAIYVEYSSPNDPFIIALKRSLKQAKAHVVDDASGASYTLHINSINKNSILQSSNTTGQVNTYALEFVVDFSLTDNKGNTLMNAQQAMSSENYTVNSSTISANSMQEQTLLPYLYRDVLNQIMARLSSKNTQKEFNKTNLKAP